MAHLTDRYQDALRYALTHHAEHRRKGTEIPYAAHLLSVSALTLEMGSGEDEAIAGLLHDVVEDGGGRAALEDIRERFGEDVARIVDACSDSWEEPKPEWLTRKVAYIAALAHKAPDELRVSLADKLHNARAILLDYRAHGEPLFDRFKAGEGDSVVWYYRSLAQGFRAREADLGEGATPLLDELERVLDTLEALRAA